MKVLYTSDGFGSSFAARELVKKVGDRARLEVTVISITHTGIPALEHLALVLDPLPARRQDTEAIVEAGVESFRAAGFKATGRTAEGHPGSAIVRAAEEGGHDLVVLGGGRRSWIGRRLLGSVSTYVLHSSPSSVMIVHEAMPSDARARILVATDGSTSSKYAAEVLARFADPANSEVTALSAVPPYVPVLAVPGEIPRVSPQVLELEEKAEKQLRATADMATEETTAFLRKAGFEATSSVVQGDPGEQILNEMEAGKFDVAVVGSRGLGPIRRAVLGSVSDNVVRHAPATLVGRHAADFS